jgi:hypothetical protein
VSADTRRTPSEVSLIQPHSPLMRVLRDVLEGVFCLIATLWGARNQAVSLLGRQGPPQTYPTPAREAPPAVALPDGTDAPAPDSPELAAVGRNTITGEGRLWREVELARLGQATARRIEARLSGAGGVDPAATHRSAPAQPSGSTVSVARQQYHAATER